MKKEEGEETISYLITNGNFLVMVFPKRKIGNNH